jgi:hypothetical protein
MNGYVARDLWVRYSLEIGFPPPRDCVLRLRGSSLFVWTCKVRPEHPAASSSNHTLPSDSGRIVWPTTTDVAWEHIGARTAAGEFASIESGLLQRRATVRPV